MKVTIAQINTTNGDIEGNVVKIMFSIQNKDLTTIDIYCIAKICENSLKGVYQMFQ